MLVGQSNTSSTMALRWRRYAWLSLAVIVLCVLSLAPYFTSSTELVRMRNALLYNDPTPVDFNWTPATVPPSFLLERGPIDPFFVDVAQRLGLAALPTDWDRALAISHHLLGGTPVKHGGAIMADLRATYRGIVSEGRGYCGDYADVFTAIALAAGMPVRVWAFSFDGFGGHGHIWPEIWNRQLGRWQLVGITNNTYFFELAGSPLSALELRQAMLKNSTQLKLALLDSDAKVSWPSEEKALAYYRRGLPEWYMWWGNNIFTYDRAFLVRTFSGISRSLEQLGGIVQGVSPPIKPLLTEANREKANALWQLRIHLLIVLCVDALAFIALVMSLWCGARARARRPYLS